MKPKKKGQTLVEVAVATVIAATTAMAVFSVLLSSFTSQQKADKREAAGFILKQAQETLKSYVSAVPTDAAYSPCRVIGCTAGTVGRWPADSSGAWALATGVTHNITLLLTGTSLAGTGSSFTYIVKNAASDGADGNCLNLNPLSLSDSNQCKTVVFSLTYQDQ